MGGSVHGRIDADTASSPPTLSVKLDGKALDLSAVLATSGVKRETRDGKVDYRCGCRDVGRFTAVLGFHGHRTGARAGRQGHLEQHRQQGRYGARSLAQAVNPFREARASNELECAVVRLPLRNGVATVDQSIALETHEVSVSASGTVDLRNETLDLSIKPRIKRGIPVDVAQFAELVHFGGPFRDPKLSIDRAGSVATVARIGAAIETGGLSVLGESLLSRAGSGGDGGVCPARSREAAARRTPLTPMKSCSQERVAARGDRPCTRAYPVTPGRPTLLAVDWGTSSVRAYWLGANGEIIDQSEDALGIQKVAGW